MAHMGCDCGNNMWDGDVEIVYDVYKKEDFVKYIRDNGDATFEDLCDKNTLITEDNAYFWLCDKCKMAHLWSFDPKYCYRTFKLCEIPGNLDIKEIQKLEEYFIFNLNDNYYDYMLSEIINENPIRPYKYYVEEDLSKVYIINTFTNKVDRVYELIYESFVRHDVKMESFNNLLIYTIDKENKEFSYEVKDGKRILIDDNDYPHRQVNYMTNEKHKSRGVYYLDPSKEVEVYTSDDMDEFYQKYSKYYRKYYYVEYLDMLGDKLYCYSANKDHEVGDIVKVPRGYDDEEVEARIVSIKYYSDKEAPYPYERLKDIID